MLTTHQYDHLCIPATAGDLEVLRRRIATHVDVIAEATLSRGDLPERLAENLGKRLSLLIDRASSLDTGGRSLVRGAVEYFLLTYDDDCDLEGPHGLDDDALVFNEVCDRIGQEDLKIVM